MVAPSLLMVTLRPSNTSLSMPRGPRVDWTASATAQQALMLEMSWGLPWLVSVPSRRRMIPGRMPFCPIFMIKREGWGCGWGGRAKRVLGEGRGDKGGRGSRGVTRETVEL